MRSWEQKIIRDVQSWQRWRDTRRSVKGHTVILTNGCFDLIHYGHIQLLQTAKLQAEDSTLVVGVNSDESVRRLKGLHRPVVPEDQRLAVVAALEHVDYCILFSELRCDKLMRLIQPDVWVKGGDYTLNVKGGDYTLNTLDASEVVAATDLKTKINIIPYESGISTTAILGRR